MDIKKLDIKKIKIAYIALAALLALGAVLSALYDNEYVAVALIVAASLAILAGSLLIRYIYQFQSVIDLD